ncbi:MAG: Alcohol dehydrogenase, zinc-binding [Hymenobacter sp.]|nr:Alcohol dehydrogenase, zinc-binding [Hymenobacter sp.]
MGMHFTFLFVKANGQQLEQLTQLLEAGIIKPIVDKVLLFAQTNEALDYVESDRAKGKVVIKVK